MGLGLGLKRAGAGLMGVSMSLWGGFVKTLKVTSRASVTAVAEALEASFFAFFSLFFPFD